MRNTSETVAVGLSGGVDSAVAALKLQQQDYRVFGLFMKNWEEDDQDECTAAEDLDYARRICQQLNIPLHTVNLSAEYWERVFTIFLQEYRAGRTPNPDVLCNQEIKFKEFLDHARRLGATKIATGHYVGIRQSTHGYHLMKGVDNNKDQSYFLYLIDQTALADTMFPLADMHKPEVRAMARQSKFTNAERKDSTGICFIGERKFREFLSRYIQIEPGDITDDSGRVIGRHQGIPFYTIGQRQGLGIGGIRQNDSPANNQQQAWYVIEKNIKDNRLVVVSGHDHPALYRSKLTAKQVHWINQKPKEHHPLYAKTRYRQKEQACQLQITADTLELQFEEPVWAITPGQSVVFYQDRECLGGGIIV